MTLDQLRMFIAVAERQHITMAAEALNRSQSAVSAAIAALENRHGVKLFDRIGRRIALTAAGQLFLPEARALVARGEVAEQALADIAGLKTGALTLAASQTVGNYWLPPRLLKFAQAYPGVSIRSTIGNTQEAAALVASGEIDLGFVEGEVEDAEISVRAVGEDELLIVASGSLQVPRKPDARWLAQAPWAAREAGSGTRAAFEAALKAFGVRVDERRIVLEMPSNEAVRRAVEAGAGLAILSRLVAEEALRSGALVELPFRLPKRKFSLIRNRQRYVSRAAQALIEIVEAGEG